MTITLSRNPQVSSDDLNELMATAWEGPPTGTWERVLHRSLGWVCAFDHELLVGFVNIAWDGGHHAFLLDTTVHGDYQRCGSGTRLVREAAALAWQHGGVEWLHVDFDDELEPFYAGCGFVPTPAGLLHLEESGSSKVTPSVRLMSRVFARDTRVPLVRKRPGVTR